MLERFKKKETQLDIQIARLYEEMTTYSPDTPEYEVAFGHLERLSRLKTESRREKVKSDTIWLVVGNILVTVIVVGYERNHVMVTRAKDFFMNRRN